MAYRSRLQRIQEKRNFRQAMAMFMIGILIIVGLVFYGVKAMAALAIFMDKVKFGNKGVDVTDKIPPAPPTIWADYTATNSATVRISGISESDSTVNLLKKGNKIMDAKADSEGKLKWDEVPLDLGTNIFLANAIDAAGNVSHQSQSISVVYANTNPDLVIEKPSDGQKFSGGDNPIEVRGKTVTTTKVYINGRLALVDGNGGFSLKMNLAAGDNTLKIRVVDSAGNETNKEIKVNYSP